MIHSEKVVLKNLLKLTKDLNKTIYYSPEKKEFSIVHEASETAATIKCNVENVEHIIDNLSNMGYVHIKNTAFALYFCLTFKAIHRFEYSFDHLRQVFFSKFLYGLITGIITGAAVTLLTQYL